MNSFKNYLPLFCIAFLLVAVKGSKIGIEIGGTPGGYKYSINVHCWEETKNLGTCVSYGETCWLEPYKTNRTTICKGNHFRVYVKKLDADGNSVEVSREFWLLAQESLQNRNCRTF
jgi:hypothetical protein